MATEEIDWKNEIVLPDIKQVLKEYVGGKKPRKGATKSPEPVECEVLLTGATGFVGAHLLGTLVSTQHVVHCLVRSANEVTALKRVIDKLTEQRIWKDGFQDRIRVVPGDISVKSLGIEPLGAYLNLAERVSAIFHAGAAISHEASYETLKATNVTGTLEVLKLAAIGSALRKGSLFTPVFFMSTVTTASLSGSTIGQTLSVKDLASASGYVKTKWASERLMELAYSEWMIPSHIFRPSFICGHSVTGASKPNDLINSVLRGIIQLGSFPSQLYSQQVDMIPVDAVARAVVALSLSQSPSAQIYFLTNPSPVTFSTIVSALNGMGYAIADVASYTSWIGQLELSQFRNNALQPFRAQIRRDGFPSFTAYTSESSMAALKDLNVVCPVVNAEVIQRYATFFIDRKLVQANRFGCYRECESCFVS